MKSAIWTSVISIMTVAAVLTVAGIFVCRPVIQLLQTPADVIDDADAYLAIYIFGLPFLFLYNAATSIFTGLGDSKTPLYFLIFSSLFNIALDILFVTVVKWGVRGVAWATFIAQGISGVAAMAVLVFRLKKIKADSAYKKFDFAILKRICMVAGPSILQQSFVSVGQLFVQGLINSFGTEILAGYSAAIKVNIFCVAIFTTMSNAVSSYTAQNTGAGKYDRVKRGYSAGLLIIAVIMAVFALALAVFGKYLVSLFTNSDGSPAVISEGRKFLWFVAAGYPFVAYKLVTDGILRGSGYMIAFMTSTFTDLIIRVGVSFLLAPFMGFTGVCLSFPIGWVLGALVSMIFYLSGKWKNKSKVT